MAGELRIGSNEGIAGGLLAAILQRLSAERPRLTFQIKIGEATTMHVRELRERTVDLLLSWIPWSWLTTTQTREVLSGDLQAPYCCRPQQSLDAAP